MHFNNNIVPHVIVVVVVVVTATLMLLVFGFMLLASATPALLQRASFSFQLPIRNSFRICNLMVSFDVATSNSRGGMGRSTLPPLQHELQYVLREQNYYIVIAVQFLLGFHRCFLQSTISITLKTSRKPIKNYSILWKKVGHNYICTIYGDICITTQLSIQTY